MRFLLLALLCTSCSTVYYNFWEFLGQEKRELLQSELENITEDQSDAKDEFADTLSKIRSEYSYKEGKLEKTYDELSTDYNSLNDNAKSLSKRIEKAQEIASDLFSEWKSEAKKITNTKFRKDSLSKRVITMTKFKLTVKAIKNVESKMKKVLVKLNDRVLFLKHNLNAKAIGKVKIELMNIEGDIIALIKQINESNEQANSFIKDIK
jgi:DNA-binding transcriptional regulator YbjK